MIKRFKRELLLMATLLFLVQPLSVHAADPAGWWYSSSGAKVHIWANMQQLFVTIQTTNGKQFKYQGWWNQFGETFTYDVPNAGYYSARFANAGTIYVTAPRGGITTWSRNAHSGFQSQPRQVQPWQVQPQQSQARQSQQSVYDSDFGRLTLNIAPDYQVSGNYNHKGGRVTGRMTTDGRISAYWIQDSSGQTCAKSIYGSRYWGVVYWSLGTDGSLIGTWDYCGNRNGKVGDWNGRIISGQSPFALVPGGVAPPPPPQQPSANDDALSIFDEILDIIIAPE